MQYKSTTWAWAIATSVALSGVACDKKETADETDAEATEKPQAAAPAEPKEKKPEAEAKEDKGSAEALAQVEGVEEALSSYETLRAALAEDEQKPVEEASKELAEAARSAAKETSGSAQKRLNEVAQAADALAEKANADLAEVRKAFGEVSRHVVGLVSAHPDLQEGLHVFECPMAKGYKKWVQAKEKLENPYMGQKMLECGGETEWESS